MIAVCDDSALMKTFGQEGASFFVAFFAIEADAESQY